jgi:uncharacterized protein
MTKAISAHASYTRLHYYLAVLVALFATPAAIATPLSEDKPFAETHIILQVSDAGQVHHNATLDIANNLMQHYGGQDNVDIEVVTFGAGIKMLYADENANAQRIASLREHGVRFYVCGNTLDSIERKAGQRPAILPGVHEVQTGVAFMIDEIKRGYLLVHP